MHKRICTKNEPNEPADFLFVSRTYFFLFDTVIRWIPSSASSSFRVFFSLLLPLLLLNERGAKLDRRYETKPRRIIITLQRTSNKLVYLNNNYWFSTNEGNRLRRSCRMFSRCYRYNLIRVRNGTRLVRWLTTVRWVVCTSCSRWNLNIGFARTANAGS